MLLRRKYSLSRKVDSLIEAGKLKLETAQKEAIKTLSVLSNSLNAKESSSYWFHKPPRKGVYIYGSVGSGKTMLMDMFFHEVRIAEKERHHFNEFMLSFHAKMKNFQRMDSVLKSFNCKLLCLDEFQVTDIADAMILRRLLIGLHQNGTTIVTTSNRHPDELYFNGIQRQSFLPCIEHIKRHMHVINLSSERDFRLKPEANVKETCSFDSICEDAKPVDLTVAGRKIVIPAGQVGVACEFSFSQMFREAHSAADYIAICNSFPRIFIKSIPTIDDSMRNELRRLIIFIDICYEAKTKVYFESPIIEPLKKVQLQLNSSFDESFALSRTISRLFELQS